MRFAALLCIVILFASGCAVQRAEIPLNVTPQSCSVSSDCIPLSGSFCHPDGSACSSVTEFVCFNSACVPDRNTQSCTYCAGGCLDGSCVLPDLVVSNITFEISGQSPVNEVIVRVSAVITNIGTGNAGPSRASYSEPSSGQYTLPVPPLAPGESTWVGEIEFIAARASRYTIVMGADSLEDVEESSEANNLYSETFRVP